MGRAAFRSVRLPPISGWLALLLLVLLGAAPRLLGLDSVPPGLHPDEAVNAYEAWSLWETGRASDGRALNPSA